MTSTEPSYDRPPRLQIRFFLLWMFVYAVLFGWTGLHATGWQFVVISYHLSFLVWTGMTAAFLSVCVDVLRGKCEWHPADFLITVPWCLFFFNTVSNNFWDATCGALIRWIDPDWLTVVSTEPNPVDRFWTTVFIVVPIICAAAMSAWQLYVSCRRERVWRFVSAILLASFSFLLGKLSLESIVEMNDSFSSVLKMIEDSLPVLVALALVCTSVLVLKNRSRLGSLRWMMSALALSACVLQIAAWIHFSLFP